MGFSNWRFSTSFAPPATHGELMQISQETVAVSSGPTAFSQRYCTRRVKIGLKTLLGIRFPGVFGIVWKIHGFASTRLGRGWYIRIE